MKKTLIFFTSSFLFFLGCSNAETKIFKPSSTDTISIFNKILEYEEVKALLKTSKADTIFVIKNDNIPRSLSLSFPKNKQIIFIEKPDGYPKYGKFNYEKLQVSFELLKINKNNASCMFLIKTIGLLGEFKLVKRENVWVITSYSKNMI